MSRPEIKLKHTGEDVKFLQKLLGLTQDGIFGPITDKTVRKFQQAMGMDVDGIVGPKTWGMLTSQLQGEGKIYVYIMYGLGGRLFSAGMEDVLGATIRASVQGVVCPPTRGYTEWQSILSDIRKQPKGSKTVVIGHSMGAGSATYVSNAVPVDLVVLYDLAGQVPTRIGPNAGRVIDIYDTVVDMVPEWRVEAQPGYENRIVRWTSQYGHTGQDDSLDLAKKVVQEIQKLANTKE